MSPSATPAANSVNFDLAIAHAAEALEGEYDRKLFDGNGWPQTKPRIIESVRKRLAIRDPFHTAPVIDEFFLTRQATNLALSELYQIELRLLARPQVRTKAPRLASHRRHKSLHRRTSVSWFTDILDSLLARFASGGYEREHSANMAKYVIELCSSGAHVDLVKRHALAALVWGSVEGLPTQEKQAVHDFLQSNGGMLSDDNRAQSPETTDTVPFLQLGINAGLLLSAFVHLKDAVPDEAFLKDPPSPVD